MKRAFFGMTLALLIIGTLVLAFDVRQVKGNPKTITVPDDCPTIQEAINRASEGDSIYVRAGTYHEKQATIWKPLTLVGENKDTTVIDGEGSYICLYVQSTHNVRVSGFTIRNGWGVYSSHSQNVVIEGNIVTDNGHGIILLESTGATVSWNSITRNGFGILISGGNGNRVCNNTITLNSGDAVWLDSSCENTICGNEISKMVWRLLLAITRGVFDWTSLPTTTQSTTTTFSATMSRHSFGCQVQTHGTTAIHLAETTGAIIRALTCMEDRAKPSQEAMASAIQHTL